MWNFNEEWDRIDFWNFDADPTTRHTFWGLTVGTAFTWWGIYGTSQATLQKLNSIKSLRAAKNAVMLNCIGVFLLFTGTCMSGMAVFAYYAKLGCDPLTNQDIKNKNQLIPHFVMEAMSFPGFPGLFIACIFGGALSTLSSNLSSLSTITWEDIVKPLYTKTSEQAKARILRIIVLSYGCLGIGITFLVQNLSGTILQASLSSMGASAGALNGLIFLGAFFPCCNSTGAIGGSLVSFAVMMWIGIGKYANIGSPETMDFPTANCNSTGEYSIGNVTSSNIQTTLTSNVTATYSESGLNSFYSLSYLWYSLFGTTIAILVGVLISFATGPSKSFDIDPKHIIPVFERLISSLPKGKRRGHGNITQQQSTEKD